MGVLNGECSILYRSVGEGSVKWTVFNCIEEYGRREC